MEGMLKGCGNGRICSTAPGCLLGTSFAFGARTRRDPVSILVEEVCRQPFCFLVPPPLEDGKN